MRYDAFISYRHSDLDMYVAKKIHKGLETFKVPRAVAKKSGKKQIKRVFRDQEELPIGSDLGDNIESALAESEYLLVICSPRTPESYWVQKEISTFIRMHGREQVLAVLVEGEPDQSFPEQLLVDDQGNPVEPLAADVRGKTKKEINKKLKTELLRLAAPLLDCSYDDLRQRHRERRMKRIAVAMAAVAVFGIFFGVYSAYNAAMIQENYEGKLRNQSKYLADTSLSLLEEGDRRAAVLVALEALPAKGQDRPYVSEAQYALSEALYAYDTGDKMQMDRVLQHDMPVKEFYVNKDNTRVVSLDQGSYIYIWDLETGERLAQFAPQIGEYGYIEAPKAIGMCGEELIICTEEMLKAVSLEGQEKWSVTFEEDVTCCLIDESAQMAACGNSAQVVFYDISTGEKVGDIQNSGDDSFGSEMAFDADKTKFAVSHYLYNVEEDYGCITVYDFETKESIDIDTMANYITCIAFAKDNHVIITQSFNKDMYANEDNEITGYIEKRDIRTKKLLWGGRFDYSYISNESASIQLKTRKYQDEITGEIHDEVMMSVDNKAYTWDSESGKQLAEIQVDSGIASLLVAANSRFGYLAQYDGTVDIVSMDDGTRYNASTIETGKDIRQLSLQKGIIVFRAYADPNLTVMRYPDNKDVAQLESYQTTISSVQCSPDETYYAVQVYDFDVSSRIFFRREEDHAFVGEWVEEEGKSVVLTGFIDDHTYTVMYGDGIIIFYNVETGEKETLSLGDMLYGVKYDLNENNTFALAYQHDWYGIIDLQSGTVAASGEIDGRIQAAVLSESGEYVFGSVKEQGVFMIEVSSGEITFVDMEEYRVINGIEIQDAFAVSNDGKILAVGCSDGVLRLLDVKAHKTVAEIPFTGFSRSFLQFSEDDKKLMMQGDDYYFRVYDLEKGEFCYVATEQCNEIEDVLTDEKTGIVCVKTTVSVLLLNAADYECLACIEGGVAYLPGKGQILCNQNDTLYQLPYMTLEMLKEKAAEQFGGEELTALERLKYNVE